MQGSRMENDQQPCHNLSYAAIRALSFPNSCGMCNGIRAECKVASAFQYLVHNKELRNHPRVNQYRRNSRITKAMPSDNRSIRASDNRSSKIITANFNNSETEINYDFAENENNNEGSVCN